ncbi:hypothetical protein COT49_00565 [candidate division WWE3 bacterium CG08_land_8_20_14_0_20_40_13]|uniref:Signal peptidase I n=1 Tax=candidate division WWE3 bacterium CG08_land_8_20_14_0_20_40_13 TaxID=1975084 RepID=A0A2H0XGQ6_UNCKA|nr:MAG: hypothetical protein COT49_00565 [candidate division WWE3 bacterium CG08_land_8_20_14_0_20_40_13]
MITSGNADTESQQFKNWLIGNFREDSSPLKTDKFELKWSKREKGYFAPAKEKEQEDLRSTLGILIYGKVKVSFLDEEKKILLENEGDYYFCKPTSRHTVEVFEDSLVITVRW